MTALLVARPLFPSESAATQGDGLPVVMLWLALTAIWLVGAIGRRRFVLRVGPVDAMVLVLVVWQCIAAVHAVRYGSPRPALNMLWEWVGLGLVFFLARQLIRDACEARAVVAAMIALTAAISVYGLYQCAVELPAKQRQFAADPEGMLRDAGLNYPPGTPIRDLFEKRLANREPTAAFALTNSLAAALAPWLVVGLGIAASSWRDRRRWIAWLICLAPIAVCLLLTKSRSGYVAATVGIIWLAIRYWRFRDRRVGRVKRVPPAFGPAIGGTRFTRPTLRLACAAVVAGLLIVAVLMSGLARPALAKAATSFGFRLQYWQATLHMIADRPWLGCGPGNFQDVYTQYKLPEASEEVADPHDFLLEVWATAGTPAMLALLGVLGLFCAMALSGTPSVAFRMGGIRPISERHGGRSLTGGAIARSTLEIRSRRPDRRFPLVDPLGHYQRRPAQQHCDPDRLARCHGLHGAVGPLGSQRNISAGPRGLGVAVLLVDLLTTGGIGMPAIAQSLWLLLALGLDGAWPRNVPRAVAIVLLAIVLGLSVACHQTSYARVLPCQGFLRRAWHEYVDGHRQSALELLQRAVDADPRSFDAHAFLAEIYLDSWLANLESADYEAFEAHDALARRMAPRGRAIWRASADRYRRAFAKTDARGRHVQPQAIEQAIEIARRAANLYPNSASDHAALAMIYQLSGDEVAYRHEAQAALELDRRMPHEDKKLPETLRRQLGRAHK